MRVSIVQSRQFVDFEVEDYEKYPIEYFENIKRKTLYEICYLIEQAAKDHPDLIVTPEAVNAIIPSNKRTKFFKQLTDPLDGETVKKVCEIAKKYRCNIVVGLYTSRENKAYNSALFINRKGDIVDVYDKVHLAVGEETNLCPGNEFKVFDTDIGKVGILICWDMQFPEAARILALSGADIIICPTWGWENKYGICRAYENGIYVVAAMAIPKKGVIPPFQDPSCVVCGNGEILVQGKRDRIEIIKCEIDIHKLPPLQYGITYDSGYTSMREVRLMRRRPELYKKLIE